MKSSVRGFLRRPLIGTYRSELNAGICRRRQRPRLGPLAGETDLVRTYEDDEPRTVVRRPASSYVRWSICCEAELRRPPRTAQIEALPATSAPSATGEAASTRSHSDSLPGLWNVIVKSRLGAM